MRRLFLPRRTRGAGDRQDPPELLLGASPQRVFPVGIKELHSPDPAKSTIDIVFVHGLTGDRERTWTAKDATKPWPKSLLPSVLPTARILTFGYDAQVANRWGVLSQNRIADHAGNLLTSLASYRENDGTNERGIIFVCHSLGGLVCKDALVTAKQRPERHLLSILHSTRGILFLGTPHQGADLAKWAERVSRPLGLFKLTNANIVEVLRRDSEVLARISDSFQTMVRTRSMEGLPQIEICCFFEELPLHGPGEVVTKDSAILLGYTSIGIRANHSNIAKFAGMDDPGFGAVSGELRRLVSQVKAKQAVPDAGFGEQKGKGGPPLFDDRKRLNVPSGGTQNTVAGLNHEPQSPSEAYCVIPLPPNEDVVDRADSAAIYGLGGSGKTHMALKFAYDRWQRPAAAACSVFWVDPDNETTFAQSYKMIAKTLDIAGNLKRAEFLMTVRERIQCERRWLLVLDNADDLSVFGVKSTHQSTSHEQAGDAAEASVSLFDYVPRGASGTVLWTGRTERIVGTLVAPWQGIRVEGMTADETIDLLQNLQGEDISNNKVEDA